VNLPENLPADIKQYILDLAYKHNALEETNANLVKENTSLTQDKQSLAKENEIKQNKILKLESIIFDFNRKIFGHKSEKIDPQNLYYGVLFNEGEKGLHDEDKLLAGHSETIHVKSFNRKKAGRKPLPENIPREEIFHDIAESEKTCNCGHELTRIGEETSEKLGYIPPKIFVEKHIRFKYACKHCEGDERNEAGKIVLTAPMPPQLLPKSILTPELLTYVLVSKFMDHIPFYRMENIFLRHGLEITRATLCNWTIGVYERYLPLFSFYKNILLSGRLLGIDETVLQVHREEGRSDTTNSYMWLIRGGTVERPILLYMYRETRSADFLRKYLKGYTGIIQTDGYTSYDAHFRGKENILHAGCMAHARREFEKLWKANKNSIAGNILNQIRALYKIEDEIRTQGLFQKEMFSEIVHIRQEKAKPILDALYIYLQDLATKSDGTLDLGKAIRYTLGQWDKLVLYLYHGEVYIDNNLVENAIRPFVLGRKNWLFSGSPDGAFASAFWYSLLQTAKANGKDPYKVLLHFLKGLPLCQTSQDCEKLFFDSMGWS
jgi:transposase